MANNDIANDLKIFNEVAAVQTSLNHGESVMNKIFISLMNKGLIAFGIFACFYILLDLIVIKHVFHYTTQCMQTVDLPFKLQADGATAKDFSRHKAMVECIYSKRTFIDKLILSRKKLEDGLTVTGDEWEFEMHAPKVVVQLVY